MFASLVATAGLWFALACAFQAVAVFVEQAGAARSPEDDAPRRGFAALALGAAALLAPGLLLLHGYIVTEGEPTLRLLALAAPIAASILGALLGASFGALAGGVAPFMRTAAPWFASAAFALAVYAALPSLAALFAAAQHGGAI